MIPFIILAILAILLVTFLIIRNASRQGTEDLESS